MNGYKHDCQFPLFEIKYEDIRPGDIVCFNEPKLPGTCYRYLVYETTVVGAVHGVLITEKPTSWPLRFLVRGLRYHTHQDNIFHQVILLP